MQVFTYVATNIHLVSLYVYYLISLLDGLSIASRLSKSINSTAKKMKNLLMQYNKGLSVDSQMSWETASHLHEQSYRAALTSSGSDFIPHDVKYEAVQKLRIVERCKEEFCLLKNDMQNCIDFFDQRIRTLQSLQEHIIQLCTCIALNWFIILF